ncbi:DUF3265 domain-containing protein [Vibrio sp. Scap24]|nr:DUF3265 domain-containing protein [Vibrio sp. Scap16]QLE96087.1 DUF3265 domain-containing protein [Vibrio sp. Scap24]
MNAANKRLRRIHNAWHLHHALILVVKVVCGSFGFALLTTKAGVMCLIYTLR